MKKIGKLIVAGVLVFTVLQVVRPSIPVKPATAELQTPPDVRDILERTAIAATRTNAGSHGSTRSYPHTG